MLKHLYLIFIATFIFGFISGTVLWLYNNTGEEAESTVSGVGNSLSLTARVYGGCSRIGCPSYRIAQDGTYTFIHRQQGQKEIKYSGKLASVELSSLRSQLGRTNLQALSESTFSGTCPIVFDGPGFTYDIEYKGKFYSLDSCKHNLEKEALFIDLNKYFETFSTQQNHE